MEEQEWLTTTDDMAMLRFLADKSSARKMRLFLCGGARSVWARFPVESWRTTVEVGERYADGEADELELESAKSNTITQYFADARGDAERRRLADVGIDYWNVDANSFSMLASTTTRIDRLMHILYTLAGYTILRRIVADTPTYLRDVIGNPFRPVAFDPSWRTEHTVGMAAKMYDDRDFAAIPILADALEEAGCDNADILAHCREPGIHVRGCWVVDLVLGKA